MRKTRKDRGFSLAEMLIVVAIIAVLMGVSFVAVQNHQRSMTRLEFDTIAKEIFVAAQNHLTAAESQGYLKKTINYGYEGTRLADDDPTADVYYIVSGGGDGIRELMLPDYALDPTVLSGSFLIRYQPSSATVLDVFYSKETNGTFLTVAGVPLGQGDYAALMGTDPNYRQGGEKTRENYKGGVIGWYGGAKALPLGQRLQAPTFEVINKEKLLVKVNIPAAAPVEGYCVKLIVTGKTSKAEAYFTLYDGGIGSGPRLSTDENNTIVLDSITEEKMQFAEIVPNKGADFFPGEDLSIKAVAYSTKVLANVAMSAEKTTNSLFADPYPYTAGKEVLGSDVENGVAGIANIRHLENLDPMISEFDSSKLKKAGASNQGIQLRDLSWTEFKTNTHGEDTKIYDKLDAATNSACYYPVSPDYKITYDGNNHKISEVKVDYPADAGLFGSISVPYSEVKNLELIDFSITGTSNAGALAGSAKDAIITNVLAHNSIDKTTKKETLTENIKSPGTAGGLIGSMSGGSVTECAAAVYVSGSTNAGGLIGEVTIGEVTSGTVTACYSGGHTENGAYPSDKYDVVGATAGGLIGVSSVPISDSYSTCSVSGTTAGGFVGSSSGDITNSYATGLVKGTTKGAFAGRIEDGVTLTNNTYYEIINEIEKTSGGEGTGTEGSSGEGYLPPIGNGSGTIEAFDTNAKTYNDFVGKSATAAKPYDSKLTEYYGETYFLKGIAVSTGEDDKFVATHYGDWPAPEIFVINK